MRSKYGLILLSVLIYMQLIFLLSLVSLANVNKLYKILDLKIKSQKEVDVLEIILKHEEKTLEKKSCKIKIIPYPLLFSKNIHWWQTIGCHGLTDSTEYFYVLEDLGLDPCGKVLDNQSVRYYRLSLRLKDNMSKLYQVTYAFSAPATHTVCDKSIRHVHLGRQMLREYVPEKF